MLKNRPVKVHPVLSILQHRSQTRIRFEVFRIPENQSKVFDVDVRGKGLEGWVDPIGEFGTVEFGFDEYFQSGELTKFGKELNKFGNNCSYLVRTPSQIRTHEY